jgi:hypothetical protein
MSSDKLHKHAAEPVRSVHHEPISVAGEIEYQSIVADNATSFAASGSNTTAAEASGELSIAIGAASLANAQQSIAVGGGSRALGFGSAAYGGAQATNDFSTAIAVSSMAPTGSGRALLGSAARPWA